MQISGIDLMRWADRIVVHAKIDDRWVTVIEEPIGDIVDAYSMIIEEPELEILVNHAMEHAATDGR